MGLRIASNLPSLIAQNQLETHSAALIKNTRKLSTGLRIDMAADDPGGLGMAERLRARVRSLEQARRNANDGISLVRTAESALEEATGIVHRLRELAIQAGTGTVSNRDRQTIGEEFDGLVAEVNRINDGASFQGIQLFGTGARSVDLHVGADATPDDVLKVSLSGFHTDVSLSNANNPESAHDSPSGSQLPADPQYPVPTIALDDLLDSLVHLRSGFGAMENRLTHAISVLDRRAEDGAASYSRIVDLDYAQASSELARDRIAVAAGIAVLGQANVQPGLALKLLQ